MPGPDIFGWVDAKRRLESDADRAMLKFFMPLNGDNGKPSMDRPQAWENSGVTVRCFLPHSLNF
jgi:hypothetical protein